MYITKELLDTLYAQTEQHLDFAVKYWQNKAADDLNRAPNPQSWTAAQCLEHLNIYGRHYIVAIEKALDMQGFSEKLPPPQYSSSWFGNYFYNMMLPKNKGGKLANKMNAPKNAVPTPHLEAQKVVAEYIEQQEKTLRLIEKARKVDLKKIRVPISLSRWIKLPLGDTFLFFIAHQHRHILQVQRALNENTASTIWLLGASE